MAWGYSDMVKQLRNRSSKLPLFQVMEHRNMASSFPGRLHCCILICFYGFMWCECSFVVLAIGVDAATSYEFQWFGVMHLVFVAVAFKMRPVVRCALIWRMRPKHKQFEGSARCTLFFVVALFGVNAAKLAEFRGFGEMQHPCVRCGY